MPIRIQQRYRPTQLLQYPLTNTESQPNPIRIILPIILDLHKWNPDLVKICLRNADAKVAHRHSQHLTLLLHLASHFDEIV